MQILLIQAGQKLREQTAFLIESQIHARVFEASSLAEGAQKLSRNKFDLVILDLPLKGTEGSLLREALGETPSIIKKVDTGTLVPSRVVRIVESLSEPLVSAIQEILNSGEIQADVVEEAQVRIRTSLLLSVCPLKGDLYIRLSDRKFVKLFREGDVFDLQDMERYTVQKGVEYLYIRNEQCAEFSAKYLAELKKKAASPFVSLQQLAQDSASVQETVRELTRQVGFSKEVQEMTRTQVALTVRAMEKTPSLTEVLKKLELSKDKYIASHSAFVSFVACAIAGQMKWGSESTFHKLSLAAFLHDITLENEEAAELSSIDTLEDRHDQFPAGTLKNYRDHPIEAAELAKKMSEVPPDVDTVIRQHHERPDGSGFPRKLTHSYIAPLSAVFIVSHDLTLDVLQKKDRFDMKDFLEMARNRYQSSQFKKILACLENLQPDQLAQSQKPVK